MKTHFLIALFKCTLFVLLTLTMISLNFLACSGSQGVEEMLMHESVTCFSDNDCDGDGLYAGCDQDDENASIIDLKEGCDIDQDGFVDTACDAYDMARDLNGDGLISAEERDINCDVCPDVYDPNQADEDEDGIGDACTFDPSINLSSEEGIDEEVSDSSVALEGDAYLSLVSQDTTVRQNEYLDLTIEIENDTNKNDFEVDVVLVMETGTPAAIKSYTSFVVPSGGKLFCGYLMTCTYLEGHEVDVEQDTVTELSLRFKVADDQATETYGIQVRLKYRDEQGATSIVERISGDQIVVEPGIEIELNDNLF